MIKIAFRAADIQALEYERYHHPHPRVQRKMEALWLKSQALPHKEICRLTGIGGDTLRRYLRAYQAGGIDELKAIQFYRPQSDLAAHQATLETYFRKHPPASIKEAMAKIEELTGIRRSENRVRQYLKSIGLKRYKVGLIPAKADVDEQEEFKKKNLNPGWKKRKPGSGTSSLWMPPTLSSIPYWASSGPLPGSFCRPNRVESVSMS
jgi:transposase